MKIRISAIFSGKVLGLLPSKVTFQCNVQLKTAVFVRIKYDVSVRNVGKIPPPLVNHFKINFKRISTFQVNLTLVLITLSFKSSTQLLFKVK